MAEYARTYNRDKIKAAERVINGEDTHAVAKDYGVVVGVLNKWIGQHTAGLFEGREHLTSVVFTKPTMKKAPVGVTPPKYTPTKFTTPHEPTALFTVSEKDWKRLRRRVQDLEAAFALVTRSVK